MGRDRHQAEEAGRKAEEAPAEVEGQGHLVVGEEVHRRVMGMTLPEEVGRRGVEADLRRVVEEGPPGTVEVADLHRAAEVGPRRAMAVDLQRAAAVGTLVPVDIRLAEVEGRRGAVEAVEAGVHRAGVHRLQIHRQMAECCTAEVDVAYLSRASRTTVAG